MPALQVSNEVANRSVQGCFQNASFRQMHFSNVFPKSFMSIKTRKTIAVTLSHKFSRNNRLCCKAASIVGDAEIPANFTMYETMIVMRPDMTDEQRDMELAKFEAFLKKNEAQDVKVTVRGRQRLAYPIKRFGEGIYVLYTYAANPNVSQAVQKNLSTPEAGSELNILRHMTLRI